MKINLPHGRILWGTALVLLVSSLSASSQQNAYRFSLEAVNAHAVMDIRTTQPLPCIGYSIRSQVQWEKDTVVIILSGFVRPSPCMQGMEPASAQIDLGLEPKDILYVKIQEDTLSNLWKFSLAEDGFHASPIHDSFTSYSK